MASVGKLTADLIARTKQYEAGMDRAKGATRRYAAEADRAKKRTQEFRAAGRQLVGMSLQMAGVGGLGALAMSAINTGSRISDMATQTRTSIEAVQVLGAAAVKAGVDQSTIERALRNTSIRTQEAIDGNKNYAEAIARLGLNIKEFAALPTERKLEAISKAYRESGASQEAFSDVAQILGTRAGPQLLEVLDDLAVKGFDQLAASAKTSGQVMDEEVVQKMDKLADVMGRLKTQSIVLAADLIGEFQGVFENAVGMGEEIADFINKLIDPENYNEMQQIAEKAVQVQAKIAKQAEYSAEVQGRENARIAEYVAQQEAAVKAVLERADAEAAATKELESKIEALLVEKELEALRLAAAGDSAGAEAMQQKIDNYREATKYAEKYNITLAEALKLIKARNAAEAAGAAPISPPESGSSISLPKDRSSSSSSPTLTGDALRRAANEKGKSSGIRFDRRSDGSFDRYVNGSASGRFSSDQLQNGLNMEGTEAAAAPGVAPPAGQSGPDGQSAPEGQAAILAQILEKMTSLEAALN